MAACCCTRPSLVWRSAGIIQARRQFQFVPAAYRLRGGEHSLKPHLAAPVRQQCTPARAAAEVQPLSSKKCSPCHAEEDKGSLGFMGLCSSLDRRTAEQYIQQLDNWQLEEDEAGSLHLKRTWIARNFKKALDLCEKFATVAEDEGHHPDLHLTDWNNLTVTLWTHARKGLTENDFIVAAKLDAVDKEGLLGRNKKSFAEI